MVTDQETNRGREPRTLATQFTPNWTQLNSVYTAEKCLVFGDFDRLENGFPTYHRRGPKGNAGLATSAMSLYGSSQEDSKLTRQVRARGEETFTALKAASAKHTAKSLSRGSLSHSTFRKRSAEG